jgi:hypothetical protein
MRLLLFHLFCHFAVFSVFFIFLSCALFICNQHSCFALPRIYLLRRLCYDDHGNVDNAFYTKAMYDLLGFMTGCTKDRGL